MTLHKIMVVEDEEDIRLVAQLALETVGGFNVELCSGGAAALSKVTDYQPDLILLDVMMPTMDGLTTLRELRKLPQSAITPIIFMTAKAQPNEVAHYKELGALEVVAKPFDPMTLSHNILAIWNGRNAA